MIRIQPTGFTRLVACDNNTHGGVHQRDGESRRDVKDRQLMDENGQRHGNAELHEHQGAEGGRGRR